MEEEIKEINLPLSKSILNRLILMSALRNEMVKATDIPALGLSADIEEMCGGIESGLATGKCFIRESGTALRLLTAFFAVCSPGRIFTLECAGRLALRPLQPLLTSLVRLGMKEPQVNVAAEGRKSITIESAELKGGSLRLGSSVSSQFATALLLVAPYMRRPLRLHLSSKQVSASYIEMTVKLMRIAGIRVDTCSDIRKQIIEVHNGTYADIGPMIGQCEADWSAAAFFYEYVALNGGRLLLRGLKAPDDSVQGDADCATLFARLGVVGERTDEGIVIRRDENMTTCWRMMLNMQETPDLVPPIVAACCLSGTNFLIEGIGALRYKESDRIDALYKAMRQMGYMLDTCKESISWSGGKNLYDVNVPVDDSGDHRIAMAVEATARRSQFRKCSNPHCIGKSFPQFMDEMRKLQWKDSL